MDADDGRAGGNCLLGQRTRRGQDSGTLRDDTEVGDLVWTDSGGGRGIECGVAGGGDLDVAHEKAQVEDARCRGLTMGRMGSNLLARLQGTGLAIVYDEKATGQFPSLSGIRLG